MFIPLRSFSSLCAIRARSTRDLERARAYVRRAGVRDSLRARTDLSLSLSLLWMSSRSIALCVVYAIAFLALE